MQSLLALVNNCSTKWRAYLWIFLSLLKGRSLGKRFRFIAKGVMNHASYETRVGCDKIIASRIDRHDPGKYLVREKTMRLQVLGIGRDQSDQMRAGRMPQQKDALGVATKASNVLMVPGNARR